MITIYKYPVPIPYGLGQFQIKMPEDAEALAIQEQAGELCLWACVNTEEPERMYHFIGVGTGKPLLPITEGEPTMERYITTRQFMGGALVVHFFEQVAA